MATDSTAGKKLFTTLAQELLDPRQPGLYNQAIMDFGAVICKPAAPLCTDCVFRKKCVALNQHSVDALPVKQKKTRVRERWLNYIVIICKQEVAIQQRTAKDIWQDLYEFPLIETKKAMSKSALVKSATWKKWLGDAVLIRQADPVIERQLLSHQLVYGQFILVQTDRKPKAMVGWQWVKKNKLGTYSFPGLINQYLSGGFSF
jgi:A/G-specific adenine glycosylase